MDPLLVHLVREAVSVVLLASAPPLGAALAVGLVVGVLQAATQVQDPAVPIVPRLVAVLGVLAIAGPWIGLRLLRLAGECLAVAGRAGP